MLRFETVEPRTFSILKELMELPEQQEFKLYSAKSECLLGGSMLYLYTPHLENLLNFNTFNFVTL